MDALERTAVRLVASALDATGARILRHYPGTASPTPSATHGASWELPDGITARALLAGNTIIDASRGAIATPIPGDDRVYGLLEVIGVPRDDLDADAARVLEASAMMLATAARDAVQRAALAETRAAEKMLAGDLRHRVRNSLQLVYNMLTTESESPWDPAGARRCEEVASRVLALAEIYDHMLAARRNEAIAFDRFLETLAARLAYDFSAESARLTIDTRLDPLTVPTGRAIALGLIAHELLVEGAREDDRAGERRVALDLTVEPTTGRARLVVRGRARPEAHGGSPGGLGLDLLNRLILQIDAVGTVREDGDDTEWVVRFPVED